MPTAEAPPRYESAASLAHDFDVYQRRYYDTATWLAETLDGTMLTRFEYTSDGHDIYAADGSNMSVVFADSVKTAERMAAESPSLYFELRRRRLEQAEFHDMLRMVRGELPNVMVVESDIPPEVRRAARSVAGYNAKRKQTMQRTITWDGRKLTMYSQSLDGSDREGLEAIYDYFGEKPRPGELLGQRIHRDVPVEDHATLSALLTGIYDRTLAARYGGQWRAGRQGPQRSTYEFVLQQHQLLRYFATKHQHAKPTDEDLYNLAALVRERFNAAEAGRIISEKHIAFGALNPGALMEVQMNGAGGRARRDGVEFDGCGISLAGSAEQQLQDAGYGNRSELRDELGSRTFYCPKGHRNFRYIPNKKEKRCQHCYMDVSCEAPKPPRRERVADKVGSLWGKTKEAFRKQKKLAPRVGKAALEALGVTRSV